MVIEDAVKIVQGRITLAGSRLISIGVHDVNDDGIRSYFSPPPIDYDIYDALWIACSNMPYNVVDNFMTEIYFNIRKLQGPRNNQYHIRNISVPKCVRRMREYITQHLKGGVASLIVDEMTSFGISYHNFLICCPLPIGDEVIPGTFFWDSRELDDNKAESIGKAISEVADELSEFEIEVNSYVSDNCNTMKKSEEFAVTRAGKRLQRKSCCSHALNNVFKDMLSLECIKELWDNVSICIMSQLALHRKRNCFQKSQTHQQAN